MTDQERRPVDRLVDGLAVCSRAVDRVVEALLEHGRRQDARAARAARARRRRRV